MPEYRLEWQEIKEVGEIKITINCAKDITVDRKEKDLDVIAKKEAEEIFEELPIFSATLKKIVAHFQKEFS